MRSKPQKQTKRLFIGWSDLLHDGYLFGMFKHQRPPKLTFEEPLGLMAKAGFADSSTPICFFLSAASALLFSMSSLILFLSSCWRRQRQRPRKSSRGHVGGVRLTVSLAFFSSSSCFFCLSSSSMILRLSSLFFFSPSSSASASCCFCFIFSSSSLSASFRRRFSSCSFLSASFFSTSSGLVGGAASLTVERQRGIQNFSSLGVEESFGTVPRRLLRLPQFILKRRDVLFGWFKLERKTENKPLKLGLFYSLFKEIVVLPCL